MRKNELIYLANKHINEMNRKYHNEILNSQNNSEIFDDGFKYNPENTCMPKIIVEPIDSASAVFKYGGEKTTLLNFASFKHPGGGFIGGSMAQEEGLCHESTLYNVLSCESFFEYYKWNQSHLNNALYHNRAIFSPGIIFEREEIASCNVLTCAAPNKNASFKFGLYSYKNSIALRSRIRFVLDIAMANNTETLILGAWGCGVFGQDAEEVAKIFKEEIISKCNIKNIVFAIPNGRDNNFAKFMKVFS